MTNYAVDRCPKTGSPYGQAHYRRSFRPLKYDRQRTKGSRNGVCKAENWARRRQHTATNEKNPFCVHEAHSPSLRFQ